MTIFSKVVTFALEPFPFVFGCVPLGSSFVSLLVLDWSLETEMSWPVNPFVWTSPFPPRGLPKTCVGFRHSTVSAPGSATGRPSTSGRRRTGCSQDLPRVAATVCSSLRCPRPWRRPYHSIWSPSPQVRRAIPRTAKKEETPGTNSGPSAVLPESVP